MIAVKVLWSSWTGDSHTFWATCSGFVSALNGNDFEIDIIMRGVCISQWRFGNASEFL